MGFTIAISETRTPLLKNYWLLVLISIFTLVWASTLVGTSDLSYLLICIYLSLHVYGSKYTYAENPFGYYLQDLFHTDRNHYDRIVHFSFGFLLAYPMREMFLKWLKYPKLVSWMLPIEITLSVSAFYELIEWAVADIFFTAQGDAYLGTQGDVWDAQKDIFLAFSGAILATTLVSSIKRIFKIYEKE